jgi:hypothetical protein
MSLIVDKVKANNCTPALKDVIPRGSVVNTYAFYDGKMEFGLSNSGRFVNAHTISEPVYIFWKCAMYDPRKIHDIVASPHFKFDDEAMYPVLQEIWHKTSSPFMKSALFYTLTRCSDNGLASSGELDFNNINAAALSKLKNFEAPENFHINLIQDNIISHIANDKTADYYMIPAGKFNYGLFEYGRNVAIEETPLEHKELIKLCLEKSHKIILTYNYNPRVLTSFKGNNVIMVDQYGKQTTRKERAREVIVANF